MDRMTSMMTVSGLRDAFVGTWHLSRRIEGEDASMEGRAVFTCESDGSLLYREDGVLTLHNGQCIKSTRRYRFVFGHESLQILFNDGPDHGTLFVELSFAAGQDGIMTATDDHYCGKDIYAVQYRLNFPTAYETDVRVSGPKKHYRALTRYARALSE